MKELFGSKPNLKNLSAFFKNPVIQGLWSHFDKPIKSKVPLKWRYQSFIQSAVLSTILKSLTADERKGLMHHVEKVSPPGFKVFL
jgi:hypothetical protein